MVLALSRGAAAQEPAKDIEKTDGPIDVIVEGDRGLAPRATRDPDVASYVVRGDALKRPGATAVQLIEASPGVEGSRSGAGADLTTVSIRGAPSGELPVYLAGVRLNDDVTGGADLSTIPLFALDRVEVYRGNAPVDADRLGIGGAIFFEPKLPRGTHVGATAGAGSFGALSLGAFGSVGDERAGALFSVSRQSAVNDFAYTDDGGTIDPRDDRVRTRTNGDATTYDVWALGRAALPGGGRLVLMASTFAREQGVVGTTFSPAKETRSATQREIAAASVRVACAGSSAGTAASAGNSAAVSGTGADDGGGAAIDRCALELSSSAITSRRTITDPLGELGFPSRARISGERWQESARVRVRVGDALELRGAVFAGVDRLGIDTPAGAAVRVGRLSVTGSISAAWSVSNRVTLFALGAGECHTGFEGGASNGSTGADGTGAGNAARASDLGRPCASGGPAGRAGVRVLGPLGIELRASGGSYVRVPALGELYGLSATVLGNPELVPERGYTGEASARWGAGTASGSARWYADVTGFARYAENLIVYKLTRIDTIKPFNIGAARIFGVEALAGADFFEHVRAEGSLTLQDPRDASPGRSPTADRLPFHAEVTLASTLEVYADLERSVHMLGRVSLAGSFRYRSGRTADSAGEYHLAEVRDLGLDASAGFFRNRVTARFSAQNLLDLQDQDLLGFALPGRSFYGGVEATW